MKKQLRPRQRTRPNDDTAVHIPPREERRVGLKAAGQVIRVLMRANSRGATCRADEEGGLDKLSVHKPGDPEGELLTGLILYSFLAAWGALESRKEHFPSKTIEECER